MKKIKDTGWFLYTRKDDDPKKKKATFLMNKTKNRKNTHSLLYFFLAAGALKLAWPVAPLPVTSTLTS